MKSRKSQISYTIKEKSGILESEKKVIEPETDPACPICQEPVGQKTLEGTTETWSELPCGHRFGSTCIKRYLGIVAEDHPQCPICRQRAYHYCNHPVLPIVLKGDGTNKQKQGKNTPPKMEPPEHTLCEYCKQSSYTIAAVRHLGIWGRFRLFLSPRSILRMRRERRRSTQISLIVGTQPTSPTMEYDAFRKFGDNGWATWWAKQHPVTEEA